MQLKSFIPSDTLLLRAEILQLTEENYDLKARFEAAITVIIKYIDDHYADGFMGREEALSLIEEEMKK